MSAKATGLYIVIEGQDATGKSTQVEKLAEHFRTQGREVVVINEGAETDSGLPSTDDIGKILHTKEYELTPTTNLLLFTAQRVELWNKQIKPTLAIGGVALASRNWWSTLAYQHFGEGVPREQIERLTRELMPDDYITPDKSVILTLDDTERARRAKHRSDNVANDTYDSKDDPFMSRVRRGYEQIADELYIPTVDASGTVDAVFSDILNSLILKTTRD